MFWTKITDTWPDHRYMAFNLIEQVQNASIPPNIGNVNRLITKTPEAKAKRRDKHWPSWW